LQLETGDRKAENGFHNKGAKAQSGDHAQQIGILQKLNTHRRFPSLKNYQLKSPQHPSPKKKE